MSSAFEGSREISRRFGKRLATVRRKQGLSAMQVSQRLTALGHELSRASIAQTERGARTVTLADHLALARALNISPVLLMPEDSERDGPQDVQLFRENLSATEFVEWWSGDHSWEPAGRQSEEWEAGMADFEGWQDWRRARAFAESQRRLLRDVSARLDRHAPETATIIGALAQAAERAEREAVLAGTRLPWDEPEQWATEPATLAAATGDHVDADVPIPGAP